MPHAFGFLLLSQDSRDNLTPFGRKHLRPRPSRAANLLFLSDPYCVFKRCQIELSAEIRFVDIDQSRGESAEVKVWLEGHFLQLPELVQRSDIHAQSTSTCTSHAVSPTEI
jgi:hypothetical protein